MRFTKKATAAVGLTLTAVALTAFTAVPASAAPTTSTIKLCEDAYNSSNRCTYEYTDVPNMAYASNGNFQDSISYIQNYSGRTWCLWTDNNYSGIQGVFQNNYTWNTLSYPYNDSISSGRPC
ncbi:hypothetical protein SAMN06272735_8877 [Streptomyces sp. TLI_55]|uniref:hypothetical protein n=1 Tax=Streptomyces sp. TLI_55 TaxID=1938861 RepID=UPI000BC3D163|nr:hypothetical protein [Streptomyces sp. TLI_55]SNX88428.1 hypothetical protein SAMN06272735_8877 [Streptomyces sp. TLI_55]